MEEHNEVKRLEEKVKELQAELDDANDLIKDLKDAFSEIETIAYKNI